MNTSTAQPVPETKGQNISALISKMNLFSTSSSTSNQISVSEGSESSIKTVPEIIAKEHEGQNSEIYTRSHLKRRGSFSGTYTK